MLEKKNTIAGLEFSKISSPLVGGQNPSISLRRLDKVEDREKIQIVTEPGTGTHGTAYLDQVWEITFDSGEQTKEITLSTLAFTGQEDLDFYLCANREDGRQNRVKIVVKPSSE